MFLSAHGKVRKKKSRQRRLDCNSSVTVGSLEFIDKTMKKCKTLNKDKNKLSCNESKETIELLPRPSHRAGKVYVMTFQYFDFPKFEPLHPQQNKRKEELW